MAGGDSVNVVVYWWLCSKVKVSRGIKPSPLNGLEPASLTSEALVAQYLMVASVLKQLIIQTVHILQLDSASTDSLPKGGFLQGNPNLLPNNLARQ
jgi:hypothetical protein